MGIISAKAEIFGILQPSLVTQGAFIWQLNPIKEFMSRYGGESFTFVQLRRQTFGPILLSLQVTQTQVPRYVYWIFFTKYVSL